MSSIKMMAIVLMLAGGVALAYGGFRFTRETHETKLGPLELSVKDKETVNVSQWLALAAIGGGALIFLFDRSKA
ncbi:MAG TPA: hypothetical protein VEL28_14475 [Candidatus Binatia bacterium]|nr:hypothetical protein [Candidatus Binatia bacterium]